jgi:hypothetical protein
MGPLIVNNSETEEFVSSSANFLDFASFFCGKPIETLDFNGRYVGGTGMSHISTAITLILRAAASDY